MLKELSVKSREEVLAEIGLGKRLGVVIARRLLHIAEGQTEERRAGPPVVIRGSEGMAVQFASCCRPIPGDPIIGTIKKDQGMVVHTHDCVAVRKMRGDPGKLVDVEWDPATKKLFDVSIKLVVMNQRGVLARVAAEIANAGSNIDNVSVEPDEGSQYAVMHFTLQVANRLHLAQIMRSLRRIPETVRISREKG
jgi:GTP pyrophosphokinase